MKRTFVLLSCVAAAGAANANLLVNGNLDATYQQEIVPGFFLPKPANWVNEGTRAISGAFEDEMSSEPWAGPAPTPVTTGGANGDDWGVFFKPFTGNATNGATTAHLFQDVAGTAGLSYTLTGWAGAEPNALMQGAELALEFRDASGAVLSTAVLNLMPTLFVDNGENFDYKQYSVTGVAPGGTATVRSRISMIGATSNPAGGGQAFVADDFNLEAVPEPGTMAALALGAAAILRRRAKKA